MYSSSSFFFSSLLPAFNDWSLHWSTTSILHFLVTVRLLAVSSHSAPRWLGWNESDVQVYCPLWWAEKTRMCAFLTLIAGNNEMMFTALMRLGTIKVDDDWDHKLTLLWLCGKTLSINYSRASANEWVSTTIDSWLQVENPWNKQFLLTVCPKIPPPPPKYW